MYTEFAEAVQRSIKDVTTNIHTAIPGTVKAYKDGKVDVQPVGKFYTNKGEALDFPLITGCPIVVTGTAGAEIAAPVKVGDSCLLIVSEQSLSEWLTGTQTHNNEQWQLTNSVAICGLRKVTSAAQDQANASNAVVVSGTLLINGTDVLAKLNNHESRITALEAAI